MNKPRFLYALFLAFIFTLPLSQSLNVKVLVVAFVVALFDGTFRFSSKLAYNSWDIGLNLIILLLGIIYTEDFSTAGNVLETNFSFVAVPIIIFRLGAPNKRELNQYLYTFTLGVLFAGLICIIAAMVHYFQEGDIEAFYFSQLTDIIDSHPTYLAYYLITSITFLLLQLFYEVRENGSSAILLACVLLFLFGVLILTGGITATVSVLFVFSFFVLKYILEPRTRRKTWTFVLVVTMLSGLFAFSQFDFTHEVRSNDYWERSMLWESAIKANPSPLWGVGTGDYKVVLNDYYRTHGLDEFADDSYNSHNQFVQRYLSNGIIGFVVLLILIGRPLVISVRRQNALGILIFFPFLIYGVTEVFLGRYQGLTFFALFHQLFIAYYSHYNDLGTAPVQKAA